MSWVNFVTPLLTFTLLFRRKSGWSIASRDRQRRRTISGENTGGYRGKAKDCHPGTSGGGDEYLRMRLALDWCRGHPPLHRCLAHRGFGEWRTLTVISKDH
jgi:hypothetical protein